MNNKMSKVFTWLFFIAILLMPKGVDAAILSIDSSQDICYGANGAFLGAGPHGSCSTYTTYKKLDGQFAFCAQLGKNIRSGTNYVPAAGWNVYDKTALIAGKCYDLVSNGGQWGHFSNPHEQYLYATELMNYIFRYNGSYDFVSGNSILSSIYNEAKNFVEKTAKYSGSASSKLPAITLKAENNSNDMKSTSTNGMYLSEKITLGGLVGSYGGNDVSYTVKLTGDNGATAVICDDSLGKNCQKGGTWTFSKPTSSSVAFYVKVTGGTAGGDVAISVNGSNTSRYSTVVRYDEPTYSYQMLMVPGEVSFTRKISTSLRLSIPDSTKHIIKVRKVDEDGNTLDGASFALYKAQKSSHTKIGGDLATNSNGKATLSYSATLSSDNDDFFNYAYCVAESKSPKGYMLTDKDICFEPSNKNVKICLDGNDNTVDEQYCGAKWYCEDAGYENPNNSSQCTKLIPGTLNKKCDDGFSLDTASNQCKKEVDATVNSDTGELSCLDGASLVGEKCVFTNNPTEECDNGRTPVDGSCSYTDSKNAACGYNNNKVDNKYCESSALYMSVTQNGNNLTFSKTNKKTSVTISKRSITGGDAEVPGAKLKICTDKPDKNGKCTIAKLEQPDLKCPTYTSKLNEEETGVSNCKNSDTGRIVDVSWTSGDAPREWKGLETGKTYYLVEETPPRGYVPVTIATEFKINTDGTVKAGEKSVENGLVVINNGLTKITISKDDIATSKELPGAEITICDTHKDEKGNIVKSVDDNGNCTVATLADGTPASWTSGDKPHEVVGLPIGTYILEEKVAPKGYSTAESIIFMLKSDGTLADKDGKSLANNKLVMHDKRIGDVKTGMLGVYIVLIIVTLGIVGGAGSYYFLKKKGNLLS